MIPVHVFFFFKFWRFSGGIAKTVRLKQKYPHLKVMVGLGGWDEGSIKYSHMASIKARRKTFIQSAVEFLK